MVFEAYYKKSKLLLLMLLGALFIALGIWMATQPDGSFDDSRKIAGLASLLGAAPDMIGHGIGWLCALLGIGGVIAAARNMMVAHPVIRIDTAGIHFYRWSPKPIGWDNIDQVRPFAIRRQKFVGLTLHDLSRDPPTGLLGKMARLNAMTGFGHVSLSVQSTDRSQEELLDAIGRYRDAYLEARHAAPSPSAPSAPSSPSPRTFGRRGL